ncbi:S-adenosyl-L-methionine-dependent methyltransferase [Xylogone sp. PMI_703]|nr:S-adenosyl-L-methionine-dependent methyltransferase [Xylogone sp. PMI_703]
MSHSFHTSRARSYDRMANGSTSTVAKHILDSLSSPTSITPFPITPDSNVLDLACGTGIVTRLIKASSPSTLITAIDLAPGMISYLDEIIKENGWEKTVTTKVADVRDLGALPEGGFTHAICNFGLAPDVTDLGGRLRAAKEIWKVLGKGGVAVVSSWAERSWPPALENVARIIRPHEEPYSWNIPDEWNRGSYLMGILEDAGFGHNVEVRSVPSLIEAKTLDEMVENMMPFKDMFYKGYSEEELARVPDLLKDELKKLTAFKEEENRVKVDMVAWVGFAWKE